MLRVVFLFLCLLCTSLVGEQCKPHVSNPCIAECNGTTFDITYLFPFPLSFSGFTWSPCLGINCSSYDGSPDLDCAVCQNTTDTYTVSCGKMSNPVWIWNAERFKSNSMSAFPDWQIEYVFGTAWRLSIFSFVIDETQEEPTIDFVGEDPVLQYNFHIIGRCIGQRTVACQKKYDMIKNKSYKNNKP